MAKREKVFLKRKTIERMKQLGIAPDKILSFRQSGKVAVYDADLDQFLPPNDEQQAIIRKVSRGGEALVYFVLRQRIHIVPDIPFLMDSFLYLDLDLIEFLSGDPDIYTKHLAYTHTENYVYPECSEDGDIIVRQTASGGLRRIPTLEEVV